MKDQQVVWITGASTGIGRALAIELAGRGCRVAITARRAETLQDVVSAAAKGVVHAFAGDVTDPHQMESVVKQIEEEVGPIDVAVLNAGVYLPVDAKKMDLARFQQSFDINVMGVVHSLMPVVDRFVARRAGKIAIVSSVTGYGGLPTASAYGATKAALINMAEALKLELEPCGVDVRVVNPGFVDTPATEENSFPMPFLVPVDKAARRIADGLDRDKFEITFPRRFTYLLKLLNLFPYPLYFAAIRRVTGVNL